MNTVNALPNLRRLFLLRNIVIAGQVIAITAAVTLLNAPLALAPMSVVIAVLITAQPENVGAIAPGRAGRRC